MVTQHDEGDFSILKLANQNGKFAIAMNEALSVTVCGAVNRGLENGWITCLTWACILDAAPGVVCTVFRLTESGKARLAELSRQFEKRN